MNLVLDAMSGDNAPVATVNGAILALEESDNFTITLVGKEEVIKKELEKYNYDKNRINIINADEIIEMADKPIEAIMKKRKSSINISLDLVKKSYGDAAISCGNTGALLASSQIRLKKIDGISRPAIAGFFPTKKNQTLVLDLGGTSYTKAEFVEKYALLATKCFEILFNKKNPTVGLLNIGEEDTKGNELTVSIFNLLKNNKKINFVGNVEANILFDGEVDIVVTDGFTGNIFLKTSEGISKFIFALLKDELKKSNFFEKIGFFLLKKIFKNIKIKTDSSTYGGAIFLGLNGISIKAHGSSNEIAIKNALMVAKKFYDLNFIEELKNILKD